MPAKNMGEYMLNRYKKRRETAILFLGGKCESCGNDENLEFDHINPETKLFTIAKMSSVAEGRFWEEIKKCQLLCRECHHRKSVEDSGRIWSKGKHGTVSSYRWCGPPKCEDCKRAKREVPSYLKRGAVDK